MSIVIFIIILGILVFVHELGHFVSAKFFGVRVDEFAIGFPPRIWSKKQGETEYSINLIPIGGYVKIYGEDAEEKSSEENRGTVEARKGLKITDTARWKQFIVLISGVLGNLIFAWFLLSAGFMFGLPTSSGGPYSEQIKNSKLIITSVMPSSPAEEAGIKGNDVILALKAGDKEIINPRSEEAGKFIFDAPIEEPIIFSLLRNKTETKISVFAKEGIVSGKKGVGIAMDLVGVLKLSPHKAIVAGLVSTYSMTKETVVGIAELLADSVKGRANLSSVAGPVGIAVMFGDARQAGLVSLLLLTVVISMNLAVINLVPFPALDGGRLFFLIIEAIIRRPLNAKFAQYANQIGFVVLLILIAFVTYKDIVKLF